MPRYIDADALILEINSLSITLCGKELLGELAKHSVIQMVNEQPTADVVPKSEYIQQIAERQAAEGVIREIFAEIEKSVASKIPMKIKPIFKNDLGFDAGVIDGKQDALFEVLALIAELKKKYLLDTNDGDIVKDSEHRCLYCQEIIPQGRDVCGMCELGTGALNKYNKNNNQGG